jgi:hypothetical protein
MEGSELLLIGGRSGSGKSSAAFALHDLLVAKDVRHAVVEGDTLDLAHPAPWKHGLAERNLRAIWANYRVLGFRRLIYTNTVSVLDAQLLREAMGDEPRVVAVMLRATDDVIQDRLGRREHGASLAVHVERSRSAAARLDLEAPSEVHRMDTDGMSPEDVAVALLKLTGWG